jgi:hypothetical protein
LFPGVFFVSFLCRHKEMKRGKIILKKESKPEQKKSHKKSPKLNHQLQKKHHPPRPRLCCVQATGNGEPAHA